MKLPAKEKEMKQEVGRVTIPQYETKFYRSVVVHSTMWLFRMEAKDYS